MNVFKLTSLTMLLSAAFYGVIYSQSDSVFKSISLNNLDAFRDAGNNWIIASDAVADYTKAGDINPVKGTGAIVNTFTRNNQMHLFTKQEFGDMDVEFDFMMAKNSNSGVYLQGRYEIQLLDSWTRLNPASSDLGGVYMRWSLPKGTFEGTPPVMNVAKAPGLWQHVHIRFRAPKFNDKGEKIVNARFENVYINGVLVQQEVSVTGPTTSAMFPDDEKAKGPLSFQGDHGPVAFRNIQYREIIENAVVQQGDQYWIPKSDYWNTVDPIIVTPGKKPSFIRTFLMNGNEKLTHVISVGDPCEINYSYDVKRGALFQLWRGKFLDVTPAWRDRGGMQLGIPMGSVTTLTDAPFVAVLANEKTTWPDSIGFDDLNNKGYVLDKQRSPTFDYFINGMEIKDSILTLSNGQGITRTVTISNAVPNVYCRIVNNGKIEKLRDDLYAAGDKSFYIRIDKKYNPVIRSVGSEQEMLVKYEAALTYSIIW
jgi:hypothetical protein